MVAVRPLVVVAGVEPPVTDDVADRLRETCIVRTACSTGEVLDRLDTDVDVVLVAPGLEPDAVGRVRRGGRRLRSQFPKIPGVTRPSSCRVVL
jgi:hypothetical protein